MNTEIDFTEYLNHTYELSQKTKLLVALHVFKILTQNQITSLGYATEKSVGVVINNLVKGGYVRAHYAAFRQRGRKAYYTLTVSGYNQIEPYLSEPDNFVEIRKAPKQIHHAESIVDFRIRLMKDMIKHSWYDECDSIVYDKLGNEQEQIVLRNDSRVEVDGNLMWLEMDMYNQNRSQLTEKINRFTHAFELGERAEVIYDINALNKLASATSAKPTKKISQGKAQLIRKYIINCLETPYLTDFSQDTRITDIQQIKNICYDTMEQLPHQARDVFVSVLYELIDIEKISLEPSYSNCATIGELQKALSVSGTVSTESQQKALERMFGNRKSMMEKIVKENKNFRLELMNGFKFYLVPHHDLQMYTHYICERPKVESNILDRLIGEDTWFKVSDRGYRLGNASYPNSYTCNGTHIVLECVFDIGAQERIKEFVNYSKGDDKLILINDGRSDLSWIEELDRNNIYIEDLK